MKVAILGAGAFGTALAIALASDGRKIGLWSRDPEQAESINLTRTNARYLPGMKLLKNIAISADIDQVRGAEVMLLAIPMQQLSGFVSAHGASLSGKRVVVCAKGIDLTSLRGPLDILRAAQPNSHPAILTGPSFAVDIARGLPTALTLGCDDDSLGADLQDVLSTPALRLYRTTDTIGAELGGALKNVIAIAAGVVIGAGMGDSARAALITRGFAEMVRLALALGAKAETLGGLSGIGDLILTCTSDQSRNFRYGRALGRAEKFDPAITVEGAATAKAVSVLARQRGIDMPIAAMVAALVDGQIAVGDAIAALMARPLKKE
jgi:glycerol-3-phosphate dehydrogenase (NAD(P)+)